MKNYKTTIVLLVAVVITGLIAYSLSKQPTSEEMQRQRTRLLPDFATEDVSKVAFIEDETRVVCERADDEWRITAPIQARADRWAVEGILERLETAEKEWSVSPAEDNAVSLADYGLDSPRRRVTITLDGPDGRTWTMLVGKPTGAADAVSVKLEGDERVFAVASNIIAKTDVTVTDLRSKKLAPRISTFDLNTVAVTLSAEDQQEPATVRCEKSEGTWDLKEPFLDLANGDAVELVADKIYNHSIGDDDFASDDPTDLGQFGLDEPDVTVVLESEDETQEFAFAAVEADEETTHYAMYNAETTVVEIPQELYHGVRVTADELRSHNLADAKARQVAKLTVSGPESDLVLRRSGDDWEIDAESPETADSSVIDQVIRDLTQAEVKEFVADQPEDFGAYGLTEGDRITVTLSDENDEPLAWVAFGKAPDEDTVYAQRADYPPVLLVPQERYFDAFRRGRLAFLDREILSEPAERAVRVLLSHDDGEFVCTRESADADWRLQEPVTGPADQWAARMIVDTFGRLRVGAFVAEEPEDLSPYGLEEPKATGTVTYREPSSEGEEEPAERTQTLLIGEDTDEPAEGSYAMLEGDPRVFVLPAYKVEQFRASLASKLVCRATDLTAFTVRRGEEAVRFIRDEQTNGWKRQDGTAVQDPLAAAVDEAAMLLEEFEAEGVADYVEKSPALYGFDSPYLTVEMETETAKGKKVVVGAPADGGRYAKGPATDFVLVATDDQVQRLERVLTPPEPGAEGEQQSD
ncbi:MAG: DUF4340 domain-containing protein [Candidatus Brocadiia bacterium]